MDVDFKMLGMSWLEAKNEEADWRCPRLIWRQGGAGKGRGIKLEPEKGKKNSNIEMAAIRKYQAV